MAINETFDVGNHSNLRGDDAPSQLSAVTVNIRAIDGANNNPTNPSFNATNTDFARITPAHFTDGVSGMEPAPTRGRFPTLWSARATLMCPTRAATPASCMPGASSSITTSTSRRAAQSMHDRRPGRHGDPA